MAEFVRTIDDIIGHKYTVLFLKNKIAKDEIPHVILFNGNPGLGKTSLAKVLAIAVNGNKESLYEPVIDRNESTDCIKLFNMSSIGDDTDIVVSELQNATFSSTHRKVIILDEVHGMTKKAQDAILVTLEYLDEDVYVFMCTTEMTMLRESLISRCITFNLNNLSFNEIKTVISNKIKSRHLSFQGITMEMTLSTIASWSNNQPRKAINLLESFEEGSVVTIDMLSAFVSTDNIPLVVHLAEYMYTSLTRGIEFIDSLSITQDFLQAMIEVLKVGLGHKSSMVDFKSSKDIAMLFAKYDIINFLYFTVAINSKDRVSKRMFTANFIKYHTSIFNGMSHNLKPTDDIKSVIQADIRTVSDNAIDRLREKSEGFTDIERKFKKESSIEDLFELGESVK